MKTIMIGSRTIVDTIVLTVLEQNKNENNVEMLLNRVKDAVKFICKNCGCPVLKKRISEVLANKFFWLSARKDFEEYLSYPAELQNEIRKFLLEKSLYDEED